MVKHDDYDYSISFSRFIAMCMIVICHMMQRDGFSSDINGAHIEWAFWFNVGVQMFLFISGLLYGKKGRISTILFYKKNFPKLLVDYYVFVVVMIMVLRISPFTEIDKNGISVLLTHPDTETVYGLGHLWFMPTILLCYFLTPMLFEVVNSVTIKSRIGEWGGIFLLLCIIHIVVDNLFGFFNPAWINCFVIGMLYGNLEKKNRKQEMTIISVCLAALCLIFLPLQFKIDYWPHEENLLYYTKAYRYFTNYIHVILGIVIVIITRILFRSFNGATEHRILEWSDKYSYDVYLTHHVFIQSPFACVEYIDNRFAALPLSVILTIVFSVILWQLSTFLRNSLFERGK